MGRFLDPAEHFRQFIKGWKMRLKLMGLLLMTVFGVVTSRSAHLASFDLPANQPAHFADFDLPTGYLAEKIFAPPLQSPEHVAVSPTGAIVVTGGDADRVIQVHEDGTLTTYADPSSDPYSGIVRCCRQLIRCRLGTIMALVLSRQITVDRVLA
jgi:hypothetical protein